MSDKKLRDCLVRFYSQDSSSCIEEAERKLTFDLFLPFFYEHPSRWGDVFHLAYEEKALPRKYVDPLLTKSSPSLWQKTVTKWSATERNQVLYDLWKDASKSQRWLFSLLIDSLGGQLEFYIFVKMKELRTVEQLQARLKDEEERFLANVPEYIKLLPTKKPWKMRDLKWAHKKCTSNKHLRHKFPCNRIEQYMSNPCFTTRQ